MKNKDGFTEYTSSDVLQKAINKAAKKIAGQTANITFNGSMALGANTYFVLWW